MTVANSPESTTAVTVKLLSLLVAGLLWLSVILERPGETRLLVPVRPGRIPAGLELVSQPVGKVEVSISGPQILLLLLPFRDLSCELDLAGAAAGTGSFVPQQDSLRLPDRDLKVLRFYPSTVPLTLANVAER